MSIQEIMESHGYKFSKEKNRNGLKRVTDPNGKDLGYLNFITILDIILDIIKTLK